MKAISISIFLPLLSVWLFKLYTLATLPFIIYNYLLLSHPILLYWCTTMSLNYFLNIYDNPFMSRLKKITFSIHPCIPTGQMSRKRMYTTVILKAVTTSIHKELCVVYLQRSKPKCIRIQQNNIAKLLHFHKCDFDKWFFPSSFLFTLLSLLFPLSSPAPSFFLSLSLFYFRVLKVSQIHGNVTNTWKRTLLEPFMNNLVTCYVCTLNRAGYMSNRLFFHHCNKTCVGV